MHDLGENKKKNIHLVKIVCIWIFSALCFPAFGLNTDIYCLNPRIQSKCRKIRTRQTLNTNRFNAVSKYLMRKNADQKKSKHKQFY